MKLAAIAALLLAALNVQPGAGPIAIEGANVIDIQTGRVRAGVTVLIEADRIRSIAPSASVKLPASTVAHSGARSARELAKRQIALGNGVQTRSGTGFPIFQGEDLARYRAGYARMKWFVRRFHEAGGLVIAGTDGVPIPGGFGLVEELLLLEDAGLTRLAATMGAAKAFRLDGMTGTITAGKRADLVILDANPLQDLRSLRQIHAVVRYGRYLDRATLDALLAASKRN